MHIFFCGIGGGGLAPLAMLAKQAGYTVTGSDEHESAAIDQLRAAGISLYIGQNNGTIAAENAKQPIDWFVYSTGVTRGNPHHPEVMFAKERGIKMSLRDELLNKIINDHRLKLIGVAGTHGKSTTTAMLVWLFKQIGVPISYSVGAKMSFAPMGEMQSGAEYFVYECDEYEKNFLAFHPFLSVITGIGWDHHEVFPTRDEYQDAYKQFLAQSERTIIWQEDADQLNLPATDSTIILHSANDLLNSIHLPGEFNRQDAWQAVHTVNRVTNTPISALIQHVSRFPGIKQRMEQLAPNLYSNYAHTAEKITGGMLTAKEIAADKHQDIVVIYEPLTNRRQHYIKDDCKHCFSGAKTVFWVPTYLAREDPNLPILTPQELVKTVEEPRDVRPAELNEALLNEIRTHLQQGDMVVAMGASGAGSLDEWLRKHFS